MSKKALELKRLQVEYHKVKAGKMELELKLYEKEEDMNRIKNNIEIQENRMNELNIMIKDKKEEVKDG